MRHWALPAFLLLAAWMAGPTLAQTQPATLLAALGSDQYSVREQATEQLLADRNLGIDALEQLYASAGTPEQRYRLMAVAKHYALRQMVEELSAAENSIQPIMVNDQSERAAPGPDSKPQNPEGSAFLGISFNGGLRAAQLPEISQAAVCIDNTYPGFPAYGMLQPGDLITQVDNQPLPAKGDGQIIGEAFREMIKSHVPGSQITLRVFRQNQWRDVTLKCINVEVMSNLYAAGAFPGEPGSPTGELKPVYLQRWLDVRRRMLSAAHPLPPLVVNLGPLAALGKSQL